MANGREWGKRIQEVREIQSVETMYKLHKSFFRFFVLPTHVLMSAESHTHTHNLSSRVETRYFYFQTYVIAMANDCLYLNCIV